MDRSDYVGLLSEVSNNDETKFKPVALERRSTRGIRPQHYHTLLEKEKHLESMVLKIRPKHVTDSVCQKGSDWHTSMVFPRHIKNGWRCNRSCPPWVHIIIIIIMLL